MNRSRTIDNHDSTIKPLKALLDLHIGCSTKSSMSGIEFPHAGGHHALVVLLI